MSPKLAELFTKCLQQGEIPKDWQNAIIVLLHKKGDQQDLANYRPIIKFTSNHIQIVHQSDHKQNRSRTGFTPT